MGKIKIRLNCLSLNHIALNLNEKTPVVTTAALTPALHRIFLMKTLNVFKYDHPA